MTARDEFLRDARYRCLAEDLRAYYLEFGFENVLQMIDEIPELALQDRPAELAIAAANEVYCKEYDKRKAGGA